MLQANVGLEAGGMTTTTTVVKGSLGDLQHKINQIIAPKLEAGKKAVVKTTEIGDEAWAVIVTEN